MLNFTVGPVYMEEEILNLGAQQMPYFRTEEFGNLMIENEEIMKKLIGGDEDAKVIFLTCSGTGGMESAIMNTLKKSDKALVVNGGSFGNRFKNLCDLHEIQNEEIKLKVDEILTEEHLIRYKNKGFTAFLVNLHETSTGILYNLNLISEFCKQQKIFLIVDAISSFLADYINMSQNNIDVLITSSQKALSLPPGISIVALNRYAQKRIEENNVKSMYFNFKDYIKNGERGQTPFTPAVSILIQLNKRLKDIENRGLIAELKDVQEIAEDFRNKILKEDLPFEIASESMSNAMTPIKVKGKATATAYEIFEILKNEYGIFICPNGGELKDVMFRVGHMGALTKEDNDKLINAFKNLKKRGIL